MQGLDLAEIFSRLGIMYGHNRCNEQKAKKRGMSFQEGMCVESALMCGTLHSWPASSAIRSCPKTRDEHSEHSFNRNTATKWEEPCATISYPCIK